MDEVTIKLPVSGKEVVIRNYTTRADDEKAESVLYAGVNAKQKVGKDGNAPKEEQEFEFPIANVMASQSSYVPRLVKSIDGSAESIKLQLDELRSDDYAAVEAAVDKVVNANSPKAKAASAA